MSNRTVIIRKKRRTEFDVCYLRHCSPWDMHAVGLKTHGRVRFQQSVNSFDTGKKAHTFARQVAKRMAWHFMTPINIVYSKRMKIVETFLPPELPDDIDDLLVEFYADGTRINPRPEHQTPRPETIWDENGRCSEGEVH